MIPYVEVKLCFAPHRDDVGELYESLRSNIEQLRPFSLRKYEFSVQMIDVGDDDDDELLTL